MINEAVQTDPRATHLIQSIIGQFQNRTIIESRKSGRNCAHLQLSIEVGNDFIMWLHFSDGSETHSVNFPLPFMKGGVQLIQQNEVFRAVSNYWYEHEGREIDYYSAMYAVVLDDCSGVVSPALAKKTCYLQQMIYGFINGNASIKASQFQKAINEVVHRMPLHETMLNSWVMNRRLMIVDGAFDELKSPAARLRYQRKKAEKYFDRGWTTLGLSDGVLAEKNYILKADLRRLSPFGLRYHNPQRNLYSTLGMKGDELPLIRSESMQALMDEGVARTGWNLTTAFVDIPDVFEDQIVVDRRLAKKLAVKYERRFQVFGTVLVKQGDKIKCGAPIGKSPKGDIKRFSVRCDSAVVKRVVGTKVNVGGNAAVAHNVVVEYKRFARDGFKITNLHGNKGVIRLMDLGHAVHPVTGEKVKLDVIVGAKTVGKRKNYGQILEAMFSNALENHDQPVVLPDDWYQSIESIKEGLVRRGHRADATWECDTYVGKLRAVVGSVFWGCIKTPEDQIWESGDTESRNCCEVRTKGLKFSHIEFSALRTRFGDDNPIIDEIMQYAQGTENLHELLMMAESKEGKFKTGMHRVAAHNVTPLDQTHGTIVPEEAIKGTVVDEHFMPDGFRMDLPMAFQTAFDKRGTVIYEGPPIMNASEELMAGIARLYQTDSIYVPSGIMRKCWLHDNGMYGLSEIGVIVNNVVVMSRRLIADGENEVNLKLYYWALSAFFRSLSSILCTKKGSVSKLGMSVRYPFSVKAVATLSTTLPKNTVEIHRTMANALKVRNGDVVLAERFPCLGFMSLRLQKVRIVDDPLCEYTIRVSGNSLVSQNLDHDGDVLFLASFHTPAAKEALRKEFENPNQTCYGEICRLNERKGAPHIKCYVLDDFEIAPFGDLTNEQHADIVEKNTGVKAQTGPVIALTYNLMRIVENSDLAKSQKMKVALGAFLEKAAQSVFEQKHGGKSLYEIVIDGVCIADVEMLVAVGFRRSTTERLCALIRQKAASLGVFDLVKFHKDAKFYGGSNIISTLVREQNKIYFASRSKLEVITLLEHLAAPAVDIPSELFRWVMSGKSESVITPFDKIRTEEALACLKNEDVKDACCAMLDLVDDLFVKPAPKTAREIMVNFGKSMGRFKKRRGIKSMAPAKKLPENKAVEPKKKTDLFVSLPKPKPKNRPQDNLLRVFSAYKESISRLKTRRGIKCHS
jgi:hypothetical protein